MQATWHFSRIYVPVILRSWRATKGILFLWRRFVYLWRFDLATDADWFHFLWGFLPARCDINMGSDYRVAYAYLSHFCFCKNMPLSPNKLRTLWWMQQATRQIIHALWQRIWWHVSLEHYQTLIIFWNPRLHTSKPETSLIMSLNLSLQNMYFYGACMLSTSHATDLNILKQSALTWCISPSQRRHSLVFILFLFRKSMVSMVSKHIREKCGCFFCDSENIKLNKSWQKCENCVG